MFECSNGKIIITRGDSAALKVLLTMGNGEAYTMDSGDVLTLTVKKRPEDGVMMKVTSDTEVIKLTPADTKLLDVGNCCFDIELKTKSGDVFTVVGLKDALSTNMVVLPEVTD